VWVLGVNGPPIGWHDSTACLVTDGGEVVAFSEEERFSRVKHALKGSPARAARFCLEQAGITFADLDVVVYGWNLPFMSPRYELAWGPDSPRGFLDYCLSWPADVATPRVEFVDHHLAHAICAFYASPFEQASVLVNDGNGETESISAYTASRSDGIRCLRKWPRSHSLGYLYDATSRSIGLTFLEAGKTMGLAAYGLAREVEPWPLLRFESDLFEPPFALPESADYDEVIAKWLAVFDELGSFPVSSPSATLDSDGDAVRIAWSAQAAVETAIERLVTWLRAETGRDELCIAGGVGLNCSANGKLAEPIYIPPVPHDAGVALGAAWHVLPPASNGSPLSPYLGSPIDLSTVPERVSGLDATPELVADRLARGLVGAIAHGRAEIGPRALCHRSILAVPSSTGVRDDVHERKGREAWRPQSPVALPSASEALWRGRPYLHRYMLGATAVTQAARDAAPAIVHVDGTARVQSIAADEPVARYLAALERGGAPPVLINTSFNARGEPIVDNAEQALASARRIGVDFLVLGDVLIDLA
jgi:carbamoyltransferase